MEITVNQIVREYMERNGYTALCNPGAECGCWGELVPCDSYSMGCYVGYHNDCPTCKNPCTNCDDYCSDGMASLIKCWKPKKG